VLTSRAKAAQKDGTILSLTSLVIPNIALMMEALQTGLHFVILYGSGVECMNTFLKREEQNHATPPVQTLDKS
jgi:hypothetical protein